MSGLALVTGATGYVGARLVPRLLDEGWTVRVLTRSAEKIEPRAWGSRVEVVEGDADSRLTLEKACDGVDVAYYLLHSMDGRPGFAERDAEMARKFGLATQARDVGRIVYLSGLHPENVRLSEHLASRVEVGNLLMASGVPTAVLQAAVVVGSGSASFEMLRHLTQKLPAMIGPKWLSNRIQPIAVRDVLHYLVGAASLPQKENRSFDIGGPDVLTYTQMIKRYARIAGLRDRLVVTVPVLTPGLASHWIGFVTPVPTGLAKPLVHSLVHEVICKENDVDELIGAPPDGALGFDEAVAAALAGSDGAEPLEPGEGDPARLTRSDPDWAG